MSPEVQQEHPLAAKRAVFARPWAMLLIILALCFLTRLPQFISPYFITDGDEAIVGLMARHIAEGKGFPLYFYGQSYGLAIFEALPAALAFKIFGVSAYALKGAMLLLWALGTWLLYLFLKQKFGQRIAIAGTLLLVFMPAWSLWSLKARGGYITAYLFFSWALYLLGCIQHSRRRRWGYWFAVGVFCCIIYLSQRLWLAGLLPWLAWVVWQKRAWRGIGFFSLGAIGFQLFIKLVNTDSSSYWEPVLFGELELARNFELFPQRMLAFMGGAYNYEGNMFPSLVVDITAVCWLALWVAFIAVNIGAVFRGRYSVHAWFSLGAILVLLSLAFIMLPQSFNPRYLLPIHQLLIIGLCALAAQMYKRRILRISCMVVVAVLLLGGAGSMLAMYQADELGNRASATLPEGESRIGNFHRLADDLNAQGIREVFCEHGLLQWNIIFLSNERLIARYHFMHDRYEPYCREVNEAWASGKKTALVSYHNIFTDEFKEKAARPGDITCYGSLVCTYPEPTEEMLKNLGFELPD